MIRQLPNVEHLISAPVRIFLRLAGYHFSDRLLEDSDRTAYCVESLANPSPGRDFQESRQDGSPTLEEAELDLDSCGYSNRLAVLRSG